MDGLLSTRVQRNYGTDHVYLVNADLALIWEDITGKKTVDNRDISSLKNLITLVVNNYAESQLNSDNHAKTHEMECNCSIYEHDICFDGVITHFSYDCLCCRNTSEEQEEWRINND